MRMKLRATFLRRFTNLPELPSRFLYQKFSMLLQATDTDSGVHKKRWMKEYSYRVKLKKSDGWVKTIP